VGIQALPGEDLANALARLLDPFERYLALGGRPEFVYAESFAEAHRRIRVDIDRAIVRDLLRSGADVERVRELFVYLVSDSGAIFDSATRTRFFQRPGGAPADRRSLEKWVGLLEDTMLISRADRLAGGHAARLAARSYPKLYASDHGLAVAFSGLADPLSDPSVRGRAFEAVVFRHLRESAPEGSSVSYVRDAEGRSEVDFIVHEGNRVHVAVEVTSAKDPSKKLDKLRSAGARLKANRSIVVHGGVEQRRDGDVWLAPASSFLLAPTDWIGGR
jgi:predicted AAA+ superfamily ATPase